jgi:ferrous iron transport protein B
MFSLATALSLLVFFAFALQCTSTMAVMARETGTWRWPALAFTYMLALAYSASFVTYQVARNLI